MVRFGILGSCRCANARMYIRVLCIMKKHGEKVRIVSALSRKMKKQNKRLSNKTIRRKGKVYSSVLELWREKSGK